MSLCICEAGDTGCDDFLSREIRCVFDEHMLNLTDASLKVLACSPMREFYDVHSHMSESACRWL